MAYVFLGKYYFCKLIFFNIFWYLHYLPQIIKLSIKNMRSFIDKCQKS